jgi:hypothetical protein
LKYSKGMKYRIMIVIFYAWFTVTASAQQTFVGRNSLVIQIETNKKVYRFNTNDLRARLNGIMNRFEFIVPLNSFKSMEDSTDIDFLKSLCIGNDVILITASLPGDKDAQLDLSQFKGNRSVALAGELKIGSLLFDDNIDFNGLLMGQNQNMAFDFQLFVNTRKMMLKEINKEQIIEIELGARGDKIIGLTSN